VFEYLEHDLAGLVTLKNRSLPVSQIKFFVRQILQALAHCHEQNIMHRDVKVSKFLVGVLCARPAGLRAHTFCAYHLQKPPASSSRGVRVGTHSVRICCWTQTEI
jgi:serine/threonine protein kinase